MQKELQVKKDFSGVGEEISHEMAADFIQSHHQKHPDDVVAYQVGRTIIEEILAQPGCAGMRFYNALNEFGQKTLVYVGVDADGKDIVKRTVVGADGQVTRIKGFVGDRSNPPSTMSPWEEAEIMIKTLIGF